jgi:epoxyqueuosine reductase QueG
MRKAIEKQIEDTVAAFSKSNSVTDMWRAPILKTAPLASLNAAALKGAVSEDHLLPGELLPGAQTAIAFFIPFAKRIAESNAAPGACSREWAEAYIATNALIAAIGDALEKIFAAKGFRAGKVPATHNFDEKKLTSRWSHRHIAFLAGLGTFGMNNMLITDSGCCGRIGTLVTDWETDDSPPAPQTERCLAKRAAAAGNAPACGLCLKKCEAGAYQFDHFRKGAEIDFNRHACYAQCLCNAERYRELGLADVCGKFLVGLPCSFQTP